MASNDKKAKQLPVVNDPDAIQAQISPSELEEEIDSSPTTGINHQASAATSQPDIRASARQAARRLSESNIDIDFPHGDRLTASRQSAGPASSQSSVSASKMSAKLTTKSASAAKSALARSAMSSKKARITSYLQASTRTLDPGFGLTVGTINAIKIATQLAPHIAAAVSTSDYDSRVRGAMEEMQLQKKKGKI
jgi:hypothetical protein